MYLNLPVLSVIYYNFSGIISFVDDIEQMNLQILCVFKFYFYHESLVSLNNTCESIIFYLITTVDFSINFIWYIYFYHRIEQILCILAKIVLLISFLFSKTRTNVKRSHCHKKVSFQIYQTSNTLFKRSHIKICVLG